jgi:hypothetical protein
VINNNRVITKQNKPNSVESFLIISQQSTS